MSQVLKIIIPMAGWGTRMRPHTWSKPKPLISVAGKTALDHLLDSLSTVPKSFQVEFVFIVSPLQGEKMIPSHIAMNYPEMKVHYLVQGEMKGQSHAIWLAREYIHGPMLMLYSDTLIETDFSSIDSQSADGIAWVKEVQDPRRFGVAEINSEGRITRLVEKPKNLDNNLALVGCYYFSRGEALISAIELQMQRNIQLKGEFYLVDAVNLMLERGADFHTHNVNTWLDTGTIEATLETNAYLLAHGRENKALAEKSRILPPVYVHPSAKVKNSIIGPNVSIGPNCMITSSQIENSILEEGVEVTSAVLTRSIIGSQAKIEGRGIESQPSILNIGDHSRVML